MLLPSICINPILRVRKYFISKGFHMRLTTILLGTANIIDIVAGELITKGVKTVGKGAEATLQGLEKASDNYIEHQNAVATHVLTEIVNFINSNEKKVLLSKRLSYVIKLLAQQGAEVQHTPKIFNTNRYAITINGQKLILREQIMGNGFSGAILLKEDQDMLTSTKTNTNTNTNTLVNNASNTREVNETTSERIDYIQESLDIYNGKTPIKTFRRREENGTLEHFLQENKMYITCKVSDDEYKVSYQNYPLDAIIMFRDNQWSIQ